jgi:hypothetical protein
LRRAVFLNIWTRSSHATDVFSTTSLSIHLWTFYTTALQFLHSLHYGHKLRLHNSQSTSAALMFLACRKRTPVRISQQEALIIASHIIAQYVETRTNTMIQYLYVMVYKAMSHITLPRMRELSQLLHYYYYDYYYNRRCGLVVRVLGYRSGGPGSIPGTTKKM